MKSRGGESNRQPPKLNSLRLQIPLSKTFLIRVAVPHRFPYVLATLAHYKGCSIFILLRSWFNDVVSHVGMTL
jgi:hypothetical protein